MFKSQLGGLTLNHQKWPEVGPEWSPGPENRPPACHGHFQACGTSHCTAMFCAHNLGRVDHCRFRESWVELRTAKPKHEHMTGRPSVHRTRTSVQTTRTHVQTFPNKRSDSYRWFDFGLNGIRTSVQIIRTPNTNTEQPEQRALPTLHRIVVPMANHAQSSWAGESQPKYNHTQRWEVQGQVLALRIANATCRPCSRDAECLSLIHI